MKRSLASFFCFFLLLFSGAAWAKNAKPETPPFSEKTLKKLVAPIALYPDPLLTQALLASVHPLQIVQAARMIHGEEDFALIKSKNWDLSVKAVAHYSSLLQMMNENLEWTETLGQAVIYQQPEVLKAVQDLRRQALKAGTLQSTPEQRVILSEDSIEIVPTSPELVYVPTYDSQIVYSASAVDVIGPLITFGFGYALGSWLDTCFYWPGYSIIYGGPYYYGWGPYWNRYPWAWDQWGWNHWGPRGHRSPNPVRNPNPPPVIVPKVSGTPSPWANPNKWNPPIPGKRTPQGTFPIPPAPVQKVSPVKTVISPPTPKPTLTPAPVVSTTKAPAPSSPPSTSKSSKTSSPSTSNSSHSSKSSGGGGSNGSSRNAGGAAPTSLTKGR